MLRPGEATVHLLSVTPSPSHAARPPFLPDLAEYQYKHYRIPHTVLLQGGKLQGMRACANSVYRSIKPTAPTDLVGQPFVRPGLHYTTDLLNATSSTIPQQHLIDNGIIVLPAGLPPSNPFLPVVRDLIHIGSAGDHSRYYCYTACPTRGHCVAIYVHDVPVHVELNST